MLRKIVEPLSFDYLYKEYLILFGIALNKFRLDENFVVTKGRKL